MRAALDLSALTLLVPSKDPLDEPSIESGYFKDEKDFERVIKVRVGNSIIARYTNG